MTLAAADRKKLAPLLEQLGAAVEDLLLTGLTAASEATRRVLNVTFQEAARMRLLRLAGTLRAANEELGRYTRNEAEFSRKRLSFFLNRSWMLARGLGKALAANDDRQFDRLLWTPADKPVAKLELVTLGVAKKVAGSSFCAFEFRMRTVADAGDIPKGRRLSWSCVFALKPGAQIPPEGYLHLPQKQKFKPADMLGGKVIEVSQAAVALDDFGGGRISLTDASTVAFGRAFDGWKDLAKWDPAAALKRLRDHVPSPLDLEVETQEEVVLTDWSAGEEQESDRDGRTVHPVIGDGLTFDAVVSQGAEGAALRAALTKLRKRKQPPPLFGLLHYEMCRFVLQPLAVFGKDGPEQLMLSDESIDRAALLRALKF